MQLLTKVSMTYRKTAHLAHRHSLGTHALKYCAIPH